MDITLLNSFIGSIVPASEKLPASYVTAVVITGLSVVFLGLIVLIIFVWAFGKIFTKKKSAPSAPAKTPQAPKTAAPAAVKPKAADDNDEVIAVIAAAVAAMGASEGKNYRLRSVKTAKNKPSRSAWSLAGIRDDTTPF